MVKKRYCMIAVVILASLLLVFAETPAQTSASVKLSQVTFANTGTCKPMVDQFTKMLNDRAKGELIVEHKGGPEVIPGRELAEAVRNGVVDIGQVTAGLTSSLVPPALALTVSGMTQPELRRNGFWDLLNNYSVDKAKLVYLAHFGENTDFVLALGNVKKITKPQELRGLMLRSTSTYDAFLKKLGISPVSMPNEEILDAMRRGVVDGYPIPLTAIYTWGRHEVTKYVIDHAFYSGGPCTVIMNVETWNRLPKHLQKVVTEVAIEVESIAAKHHAEENAKAYDLLRGAGVEFIKFSLDDAKWYVGLAREAQWERILKKEPEFGAKLKAITEK